MRCQGWLLLVLIALGPPLSGCRSDASISRPGGMLATTSRPITAAAESREATPHVTAAGDHVDDVRDSLRSAAFEQEENQRLPPPVGESPGTESPAFKPPTAQLPVPADVVHPNLEEIAAPRPLELHEVVRCVLETYPPLISAMLERQIADGRQLSAWGAFDLQFQVSSIAAPEGFYETYRNGLLLEQPVFAGGYLYGGYRLGRGNFQPWFGERDTHDGGEFSGGFGVPLLQDRSIDKRRDALFRAGLARQAVEPAVRAQLLEFVRIASRAYWSWVAAGQTLAAQRELLNLAQQRVRQIEERVAAGDLERIARLNNDQLIAARETRVIESERQLQEAAIRLSLFLRTAAGQPSIPDSSRLRPDFPEYFVPNPRQLDDDITRAVAQRPELRELTLVAEQVRVELAQAENLLLPKLDARLLASKDVGAPASPKGDKTPFELEVGVYGDVPLQRRDARGKIETARGKLAQIEANRRFLVDRVTAVVQDAFSALEAAAGRIERARTNLRLAGETLVLGRAQFDEGDIDLITLNLYEQAVNDARLVLISAEADFVTALADYHAALALDPPIDPAR